MWAIVTTLIVYQVVLLAVGWWARSRAESVDEYFIGGRKLGPYVGALSYAAGSSSAWSILGVSGIAFSQGVSSIWLLPGTLAGHLVVWFWIAPKLRNLSHEHQWVTLTDMLAWRLKPPSASATYRISAVVILFSFTFYVAAQFQGAANTFTAVFDFNFTVALLIGATVVVLYTLLGGFWAVNLTDALQAVLMLIACIALPAIALAEVLSATNGWGGLLEKLASGKDGYGEFLGGNNGWFAIGMLLGMASIGFGPLGQPHLLNRIMALQDEAHIATARRVALAWFVVVLGGMFLLGLCGHILIGETIGSEQVFFVLADQLMPEILTGVLIAAVLSAIMSTADSQLLVAGAALHHDLQRAGNKRHLAPRIAVVGVAIAAVCLALWLPESIFSRVLFAWNALGAAFGPVIIARLLGWRVSDWAVPTAICIGFGLTVLFYTLPNGPGDLWERAVPFVAAIVTLWWARTSSK